MSEGQHGLLTLTENFDIDQELTTWFREYLVRLRTYGYIRITVIGGEVLGK